ncbi:MAG: DNA primase [Burkholderiales bacterium]|nr:DNA primase [Burkholderiales bacterium]MCE1176745.1 DNA primase [Burkholderiales bacterium]
MIPAEFINDVLARVDIVDVVGQYVQLKQAGMNRQGLCPFHNEKSPSFTVSPTKQFYHCFGCGAHGTALGFLMEHNGLTFIEALKDLAQRAGMKMPEDKPLSRQQIAEQTERKIRTQNISQALDEAAKFYKAQLPKHPEAVGYLKRRGLTGEIAQKFGLGYAPEHPNLSSVFTDYAESSSLIDAGLVKQREDSTRRYDFFRDRVMFPIRNIKGQIIGFGGRILDKGEPKYLNSPETPVFQKNQELYGLFEARASISHQKFALVVEGYMDVVALAQSDIHNAVATLGTATSALHIQKLFRFTDTIVFSFDGDSAGRKAAWRAMTNALPYTSDTRTIKFLFLPPEHDPDTFVREFGTDKFNAEISTAMTLSQFLLYGLKQAAPEANAEARARQLHLAKPLLQAMPNTALRTQIIQAIAEQLRIQPNDVIEYAELSTNQRPAKRGIEKSKRSQPLTAVEQALRLILEHPNIAVHANLNLWTQQPQHPALTELIVFLQTQPKLPEAALHHHLEQLNHWTLYQYILQKQMQTPEITAEDALTTLQALEKHLHRQHLDNRLNVLAKQLTHDLSVKDEYSQLLRERAQLI